MGVKFTPAIVSLHNYSPPGNWTLSISQRKWTRQIIWNTNITEFVYADKPEPPVWQRFIFYTQKNPTFGIYLPQKSPYFLAHPKKSHTNSKSRSCYCWFELMKNTIPKKLSVYFSNPKNSSIFQRPPQNTFWPKFQTQKNSLPPPPHHQNMWMGPLGLNPYFYWFTNPKESGNKKMLLLSTKYTCT